MEAPALHITARTVKRYTTALLFLFAFGLISTDAIGQQAPRQANYPYEQLLVSAARRYRLDICILRAQMNQESGFKPGVVSVKGAQGLMQLMPATAARFGVQNVFDVTQNIEGAARYMRWLLDLFGGDYTLALAGYNAGEGAVLKYGRRVPPYQETQEYVMRIQRQAMICRASSASPVPSLPIEMMVGNTSMRQRIVPAEIVTDGPVPAVQPPLKVETASRYFFQ